MSNLSSSNGDCDVAKIYQGCADNVQMRWNMVSNRLQKYVDFLGLAWRINHLIFLIFFKITINISWFGVKTEETSKDQEKTYIKQKFSILTFWIIFSCAAGSHGVARSLRERNVFRKTYLFEQEIVLFYFYDLFFEIYIYFLYI